VTLIVGIKCSDGVVIGADGAATFGPPFAEHTIQQSVRKLTGIDDQIILGVSGPIAFSQIYNREIEKLSKQQFLKKPETALASIQDAVWRHLEKEWNAAGTVSKALGQNALSAVLSGAVVAVSILDEPSLFQFNHQCTFEEATTYLPFVAIGSGQKLADPFLAFLKRIFWPNAPPLLSDGILATLWTLQQAIRTNTGGVSHPIQIMTLSKIANKWAVRELAPGDLEEHEQNISDAEQALANYKKEQTTKAAVDIPIP
jgi:20S proteasome alpha/beta subunit